jgi:hypothetical protein
MPELVLDSDSMPELVSMPAPLVDVLPAPRLVLKRPELVSMPAPLVDVLPAPRLVLKRQVTGVI